MKTVALPLHGYFYEETEESIEVYQEQEIGNRRHVLLVRREKEQVSHVSKMISHYEKHTPTEFTRNVDGNALLAYIQNGTLRILVNGLLCAKFSGLETQQILPKVAEYLRAYLSWGILTMRIKYYIQDKEVLMLEVPVDTSRGGFDAEEVADNAILDHLTHRWEFTDRAQGEPQLSPPKITKGDNK